MEIKKASLLTRAEVVDLQQFLLVTLKKEPLPQQPYQLNDEHQKKNLPKLKGYKHSKIDLIKREMQQ
jgi:hypothetical protein